MKTIIAILVLALVASMAMADHCHADDSHESECAGHADCNNVDSAVVWVTWQEDNGFTQPKVQLPVDASSYTFEVIGNGEDFCQANHALKGVPLLFGCDYLEIRPSSVQTTYVINDDTGQTFRCHRQTDSPATWACF